MKWWRRIRKLYKKRSTSFEEKSMIKSLKRWSNKPIKSSLGVNHKNIWKATRILFKVWDRKKLCSNKKLKLSRLKSKDCRVIIGHLRAILVQEDLQLWLRNPHLKKYRCQKRFRKSKYHKFHEKIYRRLRGIQYLVSIVC